MKKNTAKNKKAVKELEKVTKLEESDEIKKFMIILITMVVIIAAIFFFTKYAINDGDIKLPYEQEVIGEVNYDVVTIGTMLGKADDEYYVIIYDEEGVNAPLYANIVGGYLGGEDPMPVYYSDLSNELNKDYIATEENPASDNAKSIEEISIEEFALVKVEDGKITKYITDVEEMKSELDI